MQLILWEVIPNCNEPRGDEIYSKLLKTKSIKTEATQIIILIKRRLINDLQEMKALILLILLINLHSV